VSDRRYENEFRRESPYGHVVTLVEQHAKSSGLVIDLGCGFGAVAEPLADGGFTYVGCDVHEHALEGVEGRGHETHVLDLTDVDLLRGRLREIAAGRSVSAVTMIDALEHLADTDAFLDALRSAFDDLGRPLFVVSIPNVAHADLGAKLVSGRWDMTPIGLLDETHLRFFTLHSLLATLGARGWVPVGDDDYVLSRSDQHFPRLHPSLSGGAPLGQFLRMVRDAADPWGEVNQFVRAFETSHTHKARAPVPTPSCFLTAIVLTATEPLQLASTRVALEKAHAGEVIEVEAHDHAAFYDAIARAEGHYVALVPEGHRVPSTWLTSLSRAAAEFPGRVVRISSDDAPSRSPLQSVIDITEYARLHDVIRPPGALASYAVPTHFRRFGTRAAEAPSDVVPWQFLSSAIQLLGIDAVRGEPVLGPDGAPPAGLDDRQLAVLVKTLDTLPLLLPAGASERLLRLIETLQYVEQSTSWRATLPLRVASAATRRLTRRVRPTS
jgi:SAM-dependent methyltransferase